MECLTIVNERNLIKSITKQQSSFIGHIVRRRKLEDIITTGDKWEEKLVKARKKHTIISV